VLDRLTLKVPLRPAQQRLVEVATRPEALADRKLHLSAPPGTGKTLVGLELARRLGAPTVVFAPTTTIAEQWRDEVDLLLPDGAHRDDWVSTDPAAPRPITVLTYQALAVTDRPDAALRAMAREAWLAELADAGHADPAGRLAALEAADRPAVATDLRRRAATLRRQVLRDGDGDVHRFLHPNARALIERLVEHGVRTLVLDECHHLLDHWAIVLLDLFDRLEAAPGPPLHVIGLTATLPDASTTREEETYAAVLGDVDVEIPTPVVVAEGSLAPYRDLVLIVPPSPAERALFDDLGGAFARLLTDVTASEAFVTWLVRQPLDPALTARYAAGDVATDAADPRLHAWGAWLRDRPLLAGAVLRAHRHLGLPLPAGVPVPADAELPWRLDDQLTVLEGFATDVLQLSSEPEHLALEDELTSVLKSFGLSLTSTGLRHGRSPVDLVLALSEAKADGAARVLAAEHAHLGDRLRALVVTDVDRVSTAAARLRGALDADAGSARRLHRRLVTDAAAGRLDPVLVTGTTVRAGNVLADDLAVHVNLWLADRGIDAWCEAVPVDDRVQELAGRGAGWAPRAYVPAVTAAFEAGLTRCLVGTRGLFGQGWDAPSCNTLVDLTAVTTATAARQLQGRVLRRDPDWPDKAAHRWDVVCVADDVPGGDADLDRFRRRHDRLWGLAVDGDEVAVVRGVEHVDPELARALADGHRPADLAAASDRALAAVPTRDRIREGWGAVRVLPGSEVRSVVRLRPARQAATVTAAAPRWPWVAVGAGAVGTAGTAAGILLGLPAITAAGVVAAAASTAAGLRRRRRRGAHALIGLTDDRAPLAAADLDALVAAAGAATRDALIVTGDLPEVAGLAEVAPTRRGAEVTVALAEAPGDELLPAHHRIFAAAVSQLLGPVRTPRYLLEVAVGRRRLLLPAPDRLAGRKEHVTALADGLAARLHAPVRPIWLHTDEGRAAVVVAWAQRRPAMRVAPEDRWI
jgi:superfamily II DNA or RNA helicase